MKKSTGRGSLTNKSMKTVTSGSKGVESAASVVAKTPIIWKALKTAKEVKDIEEKMKIIKKQMDENEKWMSTHFHDDMVDDTLNIIEQCEGHYLIDYYSICFLSTFAVDFETKNKMVDKGIPLHVMRIVKVNIADRHLPYEGCKFLKKLMIKSGLALKLYDMKIVEFICDVMNKNLSNEKVIKEGCKCLKQFLVACIDRDNISQISMKMIVHLLKDSSLKNQFDMETFDEIHVLLDYCNNLNTLIDLKLPTVLFEILRRVKKLDVLKSGLEILRRIFKNVENVDIEVKIKASKEIIDALEKEQENSQVNEFCLKIFCNLVVDTNIQNDPYAWEIARITCKTNERDFKVFVTPDQRNDYGYGTFCIPKYTIHHSALVIVNHLSNNPNNIAVMVDNGACNILTQFYFYSQVPNQEICDILVRFLESPYSPIVRQNCIWAQRRFHAGICVTPQLQHSFAAVQLLAFKANPDIVNIGREYLDLRLFFNANNIEFERMKNWARMVHVNELRREMIGWSIPRSIIYFLQLQNAFSAQFGLGLWILSQLLQDRENITGFKNLGIEDVAKEGLQKYSRERIDFYLADCDVGYYSEEILRLYPGNEDFLLDYSKQASASLSASMYVKSAARKTITITAPTA